MARPYGDAWTLGSWFRLARRGALRAERCFRRGLVSPGCFPAQNPVRQTVTRTVASTQPNSGGVPSAFRWVLVVVGALAVGGAVYYAWTRSGDPPLTASLICVTDGCGYTDSRSLEIGETLPGKCPKCGKDSVFSAFLCPKCKTPNVMNADRGLPGATKCSKCQSEIHHGV